MKSRDGDEHDCAGEGAVDVLDDDDHEVGGCCSGGGEEGYDELGGDLDISLSVKY